MINLQTMIYNTQFKVTLALPPSSNHKGKRKIIDNNVIRKMVESVEKEYPSNELISRLGQKIRELKEEMVDMREWAELLLFFNTSLGTSIGNQPITNQATC